MNKTSLPKFPVVISSSYSVGKEQILKHTVKFEILNGHSWGAIWSYRGLRITKKDRTSELLLRGRVPGGLGLTVLGKHAKQLYFLSFCYSFEPISKKSKKPRQGDHSNFEFLGCESMQGSPRGCGGGRRSPPPLGGSSASFKQQSRNSNFE